jgi:hypothetical protein
LSSGVELELHETVYGAVPPDNFADAVTVAPSLLAEARTEGVSWGAAGTSRPVRPC